MIFVYNNSPFRRRALCFHRIYISKTCLVCASMVTEKIFLIEFGRHLDLERDHVVDLQEREQVLLAILGDILKLMNSVCKCVSR